MTCCRYLKYKPCRIPLTESKLSESREPWILVCSQPRLPLPPTQSGQNKFTLKLFFCTELILLKRKTVTFLALTGAQEMHISIRLSCMVCNPKSLNTLSWLYRKTLKDTVIGIYCDFIEPPCHLSIFEVFVSQPELKTEDRGEQRQVAVLNKISRKIFIFPRIHFIRQYFQIHQNCEHFILIPTWPQLLFGVLTEILAFTYCKKSFFYKSFTVDILY